MGLAWFAARGTAKPFSNHEKDHEQDHAGEGARATRAYGSLLAANIFVTSLKITTDANSTRNTKAVW